MALDFPNSPVDGEVYSGFMWDDTAGLWRVRGSITNPAGVGSTSGSPVVDTTGGVTTYIFKSSGSITFDVAGTIDLLVVGGGGCGSYANVSSSVYAGGGGGAGGFLEIFGHWVETGSYTVTVGSGQADSVVNGRGQTVGGGQSAFGEIVVPGGGNGSPGDYAYQGASGGGHGYIPTVAYNNSIPGFGNQGGLGASPGSYPGGGGGGAGAAGGNAPSTSAGGNGGNGLTTSIISTTLATSAGVGEVSGGAVYFAGGGCGGSRNNVYGTGGLGGGAGSQRSGNDAYNGLANTGGGGAGSALNNGSSTGIYAGGSGVVIVRIGA